MKHRPQIESGLPIQLNQVDPMQPVKDTASYKVGYQVGLTGSLGTNPYGEKTADREHWKLGWCAGFTDGFP